MRTTTSFLCIWYNVLRKDFFTMVYNKELSKQGQKLTLKLQNNMDATSDATKYVSMAMQCLTKEDYEEIDDLNAQAEQFINERIPVLSDIPLAQIQQYIDLLSSFTDKELKESDTHNILLFIASKLTTLMRLVNPEWDKGWEPDEDNIDFSFDFFSSKYRNILEKNKTLEVGSTKWNDNIAEIIFLCYRSGYLGI